MSLRVVVRIVGVYVRDTEFSAILCVSLLVAGRNGGFCARDTEFSAILGVSLQVAGQYAVFCVRDTGFSAVLGVSLLATWQIAVRDGLRMLDGDAGENVVWLSLVVCQLVCLAGSQTSSPMM